MNLRTPWRWHSWYFHSETNEEFLVCLLKFYLFQVRLCCSWTSSLFLVVSNQAILDQLIEKKKQQEAERKKEAKISINKSKKSFNVLRKKNWIVVIKLRFRWWWRRWSRRWIPTGRGIKWRYIGKCESCRIRYATFTNKKSWEAKKITNIFSILLYMYSSSLKVSFPNNVQYLNRENTRF